MFCLAKHNMEYNIVTIQATRNIVQLYFRLGGAGNILRERIFLFELLSPRQRFSKEVAHLTLKSKTETRVWNRDNG